MNAVAAAAPLTGFMLQPEHDDLAEQFAAQLLQRLQDNQTDFRSLFGSDAVLDLSVGRERQMRRRLGGTEEAAIAPDYLKWIGGTYYPTVAAFIAEAEEYGVSQRIGFMPKGMMRGVSRVFLVHAQRADPKPAKAEIAAGKTWVTGHIFGYFVPAGVELILNDTDPAARALVTERLAAAGISLVSVATAAAEPERGCGKRVHGAAYLVTGPRSWEAMADLSRDLKVGVTVQGHIAVLSPNVPYRGKFFRGLRGFPSAEQRELGLSA